MALMLLRDSAYIENHFISECHIFCGKPARVSKTIKVAFFNNLNFVTLSGT
jgi:hypothetical protein